MPKTIKHQSGLLDSWGRRNRKNPDKLCANCGSAFKPHRASSRYCSRRCSWSNNGKASTERRKPEIWWVSSKGYIIGRVWVNGKQAHTKQHRWLMEKHLGRKLAPDEDAHHRNGVKNDNRIENLVVLSHSQHSRITNGERSYKKGSKLNLTKEERAVRSERARAMKLAELGRAALARPADGKDTP